MDTEGKSLPVSGPQPSHLKKGLMVLISQVSGDTEMSTEESDLKSQQVIEKVVLLLCMGILSEATGAERL